MAELLVRVDTADFDRLARRFALVGTNIRPALMRAVNHTGDKARTQLTRALTKQTGLKSRVVRAALRTFPAGLSAIVYRIVARGGFVSLKEFGARQTGKGVSASPWGKRRVFAHTFIVASLGGHVFERTGKGRLPIRKLWGPAIPREMVRDEVKAAFEGEVGASLPTRLSYEIARILASTAA
jgi:hypothetical protein